MERDARGKERVWENKKRKQTIHSQDSSHIKNKDMASRVMNCCSRINEMENFSRKRAKHR